MSRASFAQAILGKIAALAAGVMGLRRFSTSDGAKEPQVTAAPNRVRPAVSINRLPCPTDLPSSGMEKAG